MIMIESAIEKAKKGISEPVIAKKQDGKGLVLAGDEEGLIKNNFADRGVMPEKPNTMAKEPVVMKEASTVMREEPIKTEESDIHDT
jgi:hypothetical protein